MEIYKINLSDNDKITHNINEIMFVNSSRNTRNGFAHDSELFINGRNYGNNTCHYLNRTWECFRYQSVMQGLVYNLIEERKADLKASYKSENGLTRLTKKHLDKLEEIIEKDNEIALYRAIKQNLEYKY